MSGICGIVRFDGKPVKKEEIQKMLDAMKNRGNDAEDIWVEGSVGFGHKMLWTTPESLHENQPLVSQDGNLVITADARIDNRSELLEKLELNDNDVDVLTDIDLILWSYEKWGEDCPKYLIGDFSFAVWDTNKQKLFCVRDRMGVKPFIYYYEKEYFVFSSEISPIFVSEKINKSIDTKLLKDYLHASFKYDIDFEKTFFNNTYRLTPASSMTVKKNNKEIERYWKHTDYQQVNSKSLKENSEIFLKLLRQSVKDRMRSAYPIGVELSGGLDSSTISSLAAENDLIKTFSLRFPTMSCDEGEYIDAVNEYIGCKNFSVNVEALNFSREDTVEEYYNKFPDWPVSGFFLPFLPLLNLTKSQGTRILLTGQGGDHVTQGNKYYLADWAKNGNLLKALNIVFQEKESWTILKEYIIKPLLPHWVFTLKRKFKKNTSSFTGFPDPSYNKNPENKLDYGEYEFESEKHEAQILFGSKQTLAFDIWHYQMAGYYNIEVWHPFYDSRLIEFALQIPKEQKDFLGITKLILQEATKDILPEIVRVRNSKGSFSEPMSMQIEDAAPVSFFESLEIFNIGLLNQKEYNYIYSSRKSNKRDCQCISSIWRTFCVELWYTKNCKNK